MTSLMNIICLAIVPRRRNFQFSHEYIRDDDQVYPAKDRTDIALQKQYSLLLLMSTRVLNAVEGLLPKAINFSLT